ncbi:MAG: hypothetical protein PVF51_09970 [Nitrospirota bacterium]|jgi:hypothetical protein
MRVRVECYAGYRGAETPRRFHIGQRQIAVVEIVARWQEPDQRCFKVRGDDARLYLLRYDDAADEWSVAMSGSGGGEDAS